MLNPKITTSKDQQKDQKIVRSPLTLKNLNFESSSTTSCSSSSSTSISNEAQSGCLKFLLSHHHSSVISKNGNLGCKTPKFDPRVRNFKSSIGEKGHHLPCLDKFSTRLVKKNSTVPNLLKSRDKFRSKCDNQIKLGDDCDNVGKVRKPSSRSGHFDGISKRVSKFEVKCSDKATNLRKPSNMASKSKLGSSDNAENMRKSSSRFHAFDRIGKKSSRVELKFSDNAENLSKPGSRYDISDGVSKFSTGFEVNLSDSNDDFTPANRNDKYVKLVESDVKCGDASRSPTPPPVQASLSPEIQGGSTLVVAAMPTTCYAAGHVLSGVTDKRKCRPKGILTTIGNNNLFESSKSKGFHIEGKSVARVLNNRRDSIVPSPTEASVCWISSPCDNDDTNELRFSQCEKELPFHLVGCSSSLSSTVGFSSEFSNQSSCSISTSDASSATPSDRSRCSMLNSDLSSEFRGVLGPSLDHLVCCPSSVARPTFKVEFSLEEGTFQFDNEWQASPDLEDSFGSGNVMQTPDSSSSPCNYVQSRPSLNSNSRSPNSSLSKLSRDDTSRNLYEYELDSVAELLRGVNVSSGCQTPEFDSPTPSFEFNPLVKLDHSVYLTNSQYPMDMATPDKSEPLLRSLPDPEVKKSWTEGSTNRLSENDELDCCRYLSDEEDNADDNSITSVSRP